MVWIVASNLRAYAIGVATFPDVVLHFSFLMPVELVLKDFELLLVPLLVNLVFRRHWH